MEKISRYATHSRAESIRNFRFECNILLCVKGLNSFMRIHYIMLLGVSARKGIARHALLVSDIGFTNLRSSAYSFVFCSTSGFFCFPNCTISCISCVPAPNVFGLPVANL